MWYNYFNKDLQARKNMEIKVLYEDSDIIVCHKDAGILSEGEAQNSLPKMISDARNGETVFPVHRLDKETTGIIVYALNSRAAAALSKSIQDGAFKKEYLAIVHGNVSPDTDTLVDLLYYDRKRGKSYVVDRKRNGVREASLEYTVIKRENALSYLKILLHTGRTHQIRVQFASRSHILVGDRRYGAPKEDGNALALLAHKLTFPHPKTKEIMSFQSESSETFFHKSN